MKKIHLDNIDSTNRYLLDEAHKYAQEDLTVAVSDYQTAGKGMGTNTWESENGKNLLFSMLIHPYGIAIHDQYILSMTEAVALRQAIEETLEGDADEAVTIKWPNDIYIGNRKVSGTRIDLNIVGRDMQDFVLGTGINVNQQEFHSDAPNPVSLWQVAGREFDRESLLDRIITLFIYYYNVMMQGEEGRRKIREIYHQYLYRNKGIHEYEDAEERFMAEIHDVKNNGMLVLKRADGTFSEYEFKEVKFII